MNAQNSEMPLEVSTTVVHSGPGILDFTQIAPAPMHDRLPEGRQLRLPPIYAAPAIQALLLSWLRGPSATTTGPLADRLMHAGGQYMKLSPGETLSSMLQLDNVTALTHPIARRLLVCTDSTAAGIPFEALFSGEDYQGRPLGFVAAGDATGVSVVRDLRLEPLAPLPVARGKPLQMLVVFSSPGAPAMNLGPIERTDGQVQFKAGALANESQALVEALGGMIRAGLLEMHFLIGSEGANGAQPAVYSGHVRPVRNEPAQFQWVLDDEPYPGGMPARLMGLLKDRPWHCLHVYAHGAVQNHDSGLLLAPGGFLARSELAFHGGKAPRVVVLNACDTADAANGANPVMNGFAPLFLLNGTVNLVGMQMKVSPDTATRTTRAIYSRLARSLFTRQIDFDEGLHDMRQDANRTDNPRLDFFCPVLYFRPVNGPIFAYEDERLATWQMIADRRLTVNPVALWRAIRWTR